MTAMSVCETILLLFQRDTTSKEHDAEAISQTTNDVVLTLNLSAFSSSAVFICIARSPHYEKIQELSRVTVLLILNLTNRHSNLTDQQSNQRLQFLQLPSLQ
eukprot:m.218711 g.218711  ORF g.218711 m.218711 type:complete len:102 (+) comp39903_c1_seq13:598-903(+)